MVLVDKEEVIKVSADLLGRGHAGIDIELMTVREGREFVGQHICLDPGSQRQLCSHAFLLRRHGKNISEILLHLLRQFSESIGKDLDLVPRLVDIVHFEYKLVACHILDPLCHNMDGIGDLSRKGYGSPGSVEDQQDHNDKDQLGRSPETLVVTLDRFGTDLVHLRQKSFRRLLQLALGNKGDQRPVQGRHACEGGIICFTVDVHLSKPAFLVKGLVDQGRQRIVVGIPNVRGHIVYHLKLAGFSR